MAMIKCWECRKAVSTTAKSCPHCGAVVKVVYYNPDEWNPIFIFLIIIGCVAVGYSLFSNSTDYVREDNIAGGRTYVTHVPHREDLKSWYEGGTLHDATLGEWVRSSYENRLATAADFLWASILRSGNPTGISGIDDIYEDAVYLEFLVSKCGDGGEWASDPVGEAVKLSILVAKGCESEGVFTHLTVEP